MTRSCHIDKSLSNTISTVPSGSGRVIELCPSRARGADWRIQGGVGDATRRAIFERLADGPHAVGELARELPVSRPSFSQHLKVLKDAGLVVDQRAQATDASTGSAAAARRGLPPPLVAARSAHRASQGFR